MRTILIPILFLFSVISVNASPLADSTIEGRWDITVDVNGQPAPSWLEVIHSGTHTLVGYFTSITGSARPISKVTFVNGRLSFSIPPQWEEGDKDFTVQGSLSGDKLSGTLSTPDGQTRNWTGVRAPSLKRNAPPVWGKPKKLLNGKDLTGWHTIGKSQWEVIDGGILRSPHSGVNLLTDEKFNDFKLHIEFKVPKGSNSGVYLRGRYEIQIADSKGKEPLKDELGAVYGFISPSEMMAKEPGEWQSFDITLVGRMLTLAVNGKVVITNQAIPGVTGGALDSNEGEPGPLQLQGDHGLIEFRNIIITPAK